MLEIEKTIRQKEFVIVNESMYRQETFITELGTLINAVMDENNVNV